MKLIVTFTLYLFHLINYSPNNSFIIIIFQQVAVLDIDEESGNDLQELLCHEYGKGKMKYMKCDITKEDQLFGAFNAIADDHGHIDIVINNAGLVNESTMDLIRKEIEVNYVINI